MYRDIFSKIIALESSYARLIESNYDEIINTPTLGFTDPGQLGNYTYKHPAVILSHLYTENHPENIYYQSEKIGSMAIGLAECWANIILEVAKDGRSQATSEWPVYGLVDVLENLGGLMSDELKEKFKNAIIHFNNQMLRKPFGLTAPNHDVCRIATLLKAGKILKKDNWIKFAEFLTSQMLERQTEEGFFPEGEHHGPSMRYNSVMITGLALIYQQNNREDVKQSIVKLAQFMTTYTFPDGCSIGAFDGRQSSSLAYYSPICPGFELIPEGITFQNRMIDLWLQAGAAENPQNASNSKWYLNFGSFFFGVSCRYFFDLSRKQGASVANFEEGAPLKMDKDTTIENHTENFDGLLHRKGSWGIALSSQNSYIPLESNSIYRLERQSRIEIWHAEKKTIVGGGHHLRNDLIPKVNVILDTEYEGNSDHGKIDTKNSKNRLMYFVIKCQTGMEGDIPFLRMMFAHGTVIWRFYILDDQKLEIKVEWDVREVKKLYLQLPFIVYRGAKISCQGSELKGLPSLLSSSEVHIEKGLFDSRSQIKIPQADFQGVQYPLNTLQLYRGDFASENNTVPPFQMALCFAEWHQPNHQNSVSWLIDLSG